MMILPLLLRLGHLWPRSYHILLKHTAEGHEILQVRFSMVLELSLGCKEEQTASSRESCQGAASLYRPRINIFIFLMARQASQPNVNSLHLDLRGMTGATVLHQPASFFNRFESRGEAKSCYMNSS